MREDKKMDRRTFVKTVPVVSILTNDATNYGQDLKTVLLPEPEKEGGKSVLAALQARKTTRNISAKKIPLQVLSNLLWAAFGVNRERGSFGKTGRTAPSASNSPAVTIPCPARPCQRISVSFANLTS